MFIKGVILMRCVAKKLAVVLYGARILSFIVFLLCMSLVNVVVMAQGTSTVNLDDVTLDTASVLALASIVLTAIGAIWGIKKLIKLANRS